VYPKNRIVLLLPAGDRAPGGDRNGPGRRGVPPSCSCPRVERHRPRSTPAGRFLRRDSRPSPARPHSPRRPARPARP